MPKNAAYLLHDLLEAYTLQPGQRPQQVRGFDNEHDTAAWRRHIEELTLVRNVDDILRAMAQDGQDVAPFRDCIGYWYAGIGMAQTPWNFKDPAAVRAACPQEKLNLLHALALIIDLRGRLDVDKDEQRTLADVLDQAAELLKEDSDQIPTEIRGYLRALIDRARFILDNLDRFGAETLRSVALELGGAMSVQAARTEQSDPEKSQRWRTAAWMLVAGFMGGAGEGAAGAIGGAVSEGIKQLGGA